MLNDKLKNFNAETIRPQWRHPYLEKTWASKLTRPQLEAYAYDYYLRFLPFFREQPEGSLLPGVEITYSRRMRQRLGTADLFHHRISLNETYFREDPRLLPYTLFHELVHVWLYDCLLDPGHNRRFYQKMLHFEATGLPVDPGVHIHERIASEAKFVYFCDGCQNRWYTNRADKCGLYCAYCYEASAKRMTPRPFLNPGPATRRDQIRTGLPVFQRNLIYEQLHGIPLSTPKLSL